MFKAVFGFLMALLLVSAVPASAQVDGPYVRIRVQRPDAGAHGAFFKNEPIIVQLSKYQGPTTIPIADSEPDFLKVLTPDLKEIPAYNDPTVKVPVVNVPGLSEVCPPGHRCWKVTMVQPGFMRFFGRVANTSHTDKVNNVSTVEYVPPATPTPVTEPTPGASGVTIVELSRSDEFGEGTIKIGVEVNGATPNFPAYAWYTLESGFGNPSWADIHALSQVWRSNWQRIVHCGTTVLPGFQKCERNLVQWEPGTGYTGVVGVTLYNSATGSVVGTATKVFQSPFN